MCACKKYLKSQKNGILMINFKEENNNNYNIKIHYKFYFTDNFEVYCFCPIKKIKRMIIIQSDDIEDTDYFFVGGFDLNKKKGMIKLYKVIYGEEYKENKIEYIQDMIIFNKKIKRFNGPISCITQSNIDGKIVVTCLDGNIYLFENPIIQEYLDFDEQVKQKISFNEFFK